MTFTIKQSDKILIVSPHADDESIGCGGLMALYGSQCDILLLTDGRKGYDSRITSVDEEELQLTREKELKCAADLCGIHHIFMLRIPDGTVMSHIADIMDFDIASYSIILVPNRFERHADHSIVPQIFLKMKKKQKSKAKIYEYEVWSPMPNPVNVLDITEVFETKEKLVAQYHSQIRFKDYIRMTRALNAYRGVAFNMKYAEVYAPLVSVSVPRKLCSLLPLCIRKSIHRLIGK